jgi:tetratricopeptide (TPR) repeat protein
MSEPDPGAPRGRERRPATGRSSGRPPAPRSGADKRTGQGGDRRPTSPERRAELEQRPYDPRREARRQLARVALPGDVEARELEPESRRQLSSLTKETADLVARHLVMAGRLVDEEPEQALAHARAARALGGRVGVVREANGLVAYAAGEWAEALSELRTARRITGEPDHLPVMADCERALGRPDRALVVAEDPQLARLAPAARVEMMIVASGARRDMGQPQAAAVTLEVPALEGPVRPWTARLRYAYADALLESGREDEARSWFARAAEVDELGETDADERVLELDGVVFEDLEEREEPLVDESTTGASSQVSEGVPAPEPVGDTELRLFD